jgi:uncharacterized membrane protein
MKIGKYREQKYPNSDFTDVMSKLEDEDLIHIVTVARNDYQALAVMSAEEEIKKRNISKTQIEEQEKEELARIEKNEREIYLEEIKRKKSRKIWLIIWLIFIIVSAIISLVEHDSTIFFVFGIIVPIIFKVKFGWIFE